MSSYEDSIIPRAREKFKNRETTFLPARFVNIYHDDDPSSHENVNDAAEMAMEDGYEATIYIIAEGACSLIDLTSHGEFLAHDRRADQKAERDYEAGASSLETSDRV